MGVLADLTPEQQSKLPFPVIEEKDEEIYAIYYDKEGTKFEEYICKPINLPKMTVDIITGDVYYIFENPFGDLVTIQPSVLHHKQIMTMADKGFEVTAYNSSEFIQYLLNLISLVKPIKSYKALGFITYRGKHVFLWDKMYYNGLCFKGIYTGNINITRKGRLSSWRKGIKELVTGRPALELVVTCAFTAILIGYIGKERDFDSTVFHFWGKSSIGKSSAVKLAASVFGSPNISDGAFMDSFYKTHNAVVESVSKLYGVLKILDDTSSALVTDFEKLIYELSTGKTKGRLSGDMDILKSSTWLTLILTTGESPLLSDNANTGAYARYISFNMQLTDSAQDAQNISNFAKNNYGTAVIPFVEKLLDDGQDQILNRFDEKYSDLLPELGEKELNARLGKMYTLLLLACELANSYLDLGFDEESIKSIIIETNSSRKTSEVVYEDILDVILSELSERQNEISFADTFERTDEKGKRILQNKANKPAFKYIGKLDLRNHEGSPSVLIISRNVIDEIVNKQVNYNQNERNKVYEYFKNNNYIFVDKGSYVKKRKIGHLRTPCFCFNVRVLLDGRKRTKHRETSFEIADRIRDYIKKGETDNDY